MFILYANTRNVSDSQLKRLLTEMNCQDFSFLQTHKGKGRNIRHDIWFTNIRVKYYRGLHGWTCTEEL